MKSLHDCRTRSHPDREAIEELCCLFVLGDLSREDRLFLEAHIAECVECRELIKGFERIALFDLPAVASLRTENFVPESLEFANENQIRARVLERAKAGHENESRKLLTEDIVRVCPTRWLVNVKRVCRLAAPAAGWAIAALLLASVVWKPRPVAGPGKQLAPPQVSMVDRSSQAGALEQRLNVAERQRDEALAKLDDAMSRNRSGAQSLAQLEAQYESLDATYTALKGDISLQQDQLKQESAQLELTRRELNDQLVAKESLQGQLSDVYERLQKNSSEVTRLERIAATTPASLPVSERNRRERGKGDSWCARVAYCRRLRCR